VQITNGEIGVRAFVSLLPRDELFSNLLTHSLAIYTLVDY
jgi:hypothetical protein